MGNILFSNLIGVGGELPARKIVQLAGNIAARLITGLTIMEG